MVEAKIAELKKTVKLALNDKEKRALVILNSHEGRDLYREIRERVNDIQERELLFKVSHFSKLAQIKKEAKITFGSPLADSVKVIDVQPELEPFDVGLFTLKKSLSNPIIKAFWDQVSV